MNPIYNFGGQVALVTGASAGIGLATATAFAEAGASVVLADISASTLNAATEQLRLAGHNVLAIVCDVADDAQAQAMVRKVVEVFGRLDMVFNNAGIAGPHGPITDESVEAFDRVVAVNLRGIWACMKHQLQQMEKQASGTIVNCSSLGGLVGQSGRTAYHGSKHGVIGITKSAAFEYAPKGIRVNAVCPGVIDTSMFSAMSQAKPDALKEVFRDQPIARLGAPSEVAAAVLWLCSPASSFVLGVALPVDGGFTAH